MNVGEIMDSEKPAIFDILQSLIEDDSLISSSDLLHLCENFKRHELKRGMALYEQGSVGKSIFVLEKGELSQAVHTQGETQIIQSLMPGTVGFIYMFKTFLRALF